MSTTTSKPTLADAIRAALKDSGLGPVADAGLRAALPAAEAADALAEAAEAASRYDTPHSCEGTVNCGGCQSDASARRNLRAALRRYRGAK